MKMKIIVALIAVASLAGCTSTTKPDQTSAVSVEIRDKMDAGTRLSNKELKELAEKTNFTMAQLKAAAKKLGYKCTYHAKTGTHLKKKVCSTKEQRVVRAAAAKTYMQERLNNMGRMRGGPTDN